MTLGMLAMSEARVSGSFAVARSAKTPTRGRARAAARRGAALAGRETRAGCGVARVQRAGRCEMSGLVGEWRVKIARILEEGAAAAAAAAAGEMSDSR